MQVDGEACKLTPSIINLSLLNKATMLSKRKGGKAPPQTALDNLKINVYIINMSDYEQHHYDKNLLTQAGKYDRNKTSSLEMIKNCFFNSQQLVSEILK